MNSKWHGHASVFSIEISKVQMIFVISAVAHHTHTQTDDCTSFNDDKVAMVDFAVSRFNDYI